MGAEALIIERGALTRRMPPAALEHLHAPDEDHSDLYPENVSRISKPFATVNNSPSKLCRGGLDCNSVIEEQLDHFRLGRRRSQTDPLMRWVRFAKIIYLHSHAAR